jgi:hypothetical protein
MNSSSPTNGEYETDVGELESDTFEFELNDEMEFEGELESPLDEVEEMELANELLAVSNEEELDQFLGKLFKKVGKGLRKFGKGIGRFVRPLGGLLKGIAKKALPFVGGALGSFIPIPGVGTAVGSALGSAASKLLEVDLEGMDNEDQEFELARRFVRMASAATAKAAATSPDADPKAAAIRAIKAAAQQLGAGDREMDGEIPSRRAIGGVPGASGPRRRGRAGRWYRRGNAVVLVGA